MIDFKSIDRYSRQMRFHGVGEEGQRKLLASKVTLCGCGALGTVLANNLARAGVGSIKVVDRDFIDRYSRLLFPPKEIGAKFEF